MNEKTLVLNFLDKLEILRKKFENGEIQDSTNTDWVIRICQAELAHGYFSERPEWTKLIRETKMTDVFDLTGYEQLHAALFDSLRFSVDKNLTAVKINDNSYSQLKYLIHQEMDSSEDEYSFIEYNRLTDIELYNASIHHKELKMTASVSYKGHMFCSDNSLYGIQYGVKSARQYTFYNVDTDKYIVLLKKYWSI